MKIALKQKEGANILEFKLYCLWCVSLSQENFEIS